MVGRGGVLLWTAVRTVERTVADVEMYDRASIGVLKRCGFEEVGREEGTFETHLGWCDSVYFELRGREGGWGDETTGWGVEGWRNGLVVEECLA